MWFKTEGQNYIGKKVVNNESCSILISDFKNVWHKALDDYDLFPTFQRLNPLVEVSKLKLKEIIFNFFGEDEKVKKHLHKDNNDNIVLKLESIQITVKFYFEILLFKGNEVLLYNEFTLPLLEVLVEMENREKKLLEIIEEKTSKLEECKQEKSTLSNSRQPENENEKILISSFQSILKSKAFLNCVTNLSSLKKNFQNKCDCSASGSSTNESINPKSCSVKVSHQIVRKRKKINQII